MPSLLSRTRNRLTSQLVVNRRSIFLFLFYIEYNRTSVKCLMIRFRPNSYHEYLNNEILWMVGVLAQRLLVRYVEQTLGYCPAVAFKSMIYCGLINRMASMHNTSHQHIPAKLDE